MLCASYSGNPREWRYWPVSQSASSPVRWPATESNQIKLELSRLKEHLTASHSIFVFQSDITTHSALQEITNEGVLHLHHRFEFVDMQQIGISWFVFVDKQHLQRHIFPIFFLLCKNSLNFRCHQLETDLNYYQWRQCLSQP